MKYIDAEKLNTEIKRRIEWLNSATTDFAEGRRAELRSLYDFIDSLQQEQTDMGEVSDGYHTFNELYYYRMLYNAAFFNLLPKEWVHKSKRHHTGEECFGGGWFIVMANLLTGQISNHYELKDWDLFRVPEKELADEWDGHTPQEAAERLHKYLQQDSILAEFMEKASEIGKKYNYGFGPNLPQPKVDLEKEIEKALDALEVKDLRGWFHYFFELGLRRAAGMYDDIEYNRQRAMSDKDFRELVRKMREAQKNYFRTRHKGYLDYSRRLEKQVDAELMNDTPKLF